MATNGIDRPGATAHHAPAIVAIDTRAGVPGPEHRTMAVTTFDTHAAVKALTKAGVAPAQAEAITDTVRDAVTEGVATKADIARLEDKMATKADLAGLRAEIAASERRMMLAMIAVAGIIVALVKLLPQGAP